MMPGIGSIIRLIDGPHTQKCVDLIISLDFENLDLIIAGKIPHFRNNSIWEAGE